MGEGDGGFSLIKIDGACAEVGVALIKKIYSVLEGAAKPWQMRRMARAQVDEEKILALGRADLEDDLLQRTGRRFMSEEVRKQRNIESITEKALPMLEESAKPEKIEDDWITNFFDKSRLVSDEQMQQLWSRVLAGEANTPGKYSTRTVNFLSSFDKNEALLFQKLCSFVWSINGAYEALVFNINDDIYKKSELDFGSLLSLDSIGLISYDGIVKYLNINYPEYCLAIYHDTGIIVQLKESANNKFLIGSVKLSKIGLELFSICDAPPIPEFIHYVCSKWQEKGYNVSYLSDYQVKPDIT